MPRRNRNARGHDSAPNPSPAWLAPRKRATGTEAPVPTSLLVVGVECYRHEAAPARPGDCMLCDLARSMA
jgi:hypothetical protein